MTEIGQARPAPVLGTFGLISLGGFVPLWVVATTGQSNTPHSAWVGALIVAIVAGARFAWLMAVPYRRLFEMATWLFFYVFMGLAPLVQLRERVDPSTTPGLVYEYAWTAIGIVLVSEFGLIVGASLRGQPQSSSVSQGRVVDPTRTVLFSFAMTISAFAYIAVLGLSTLWASRALRDRAVSALVGDQITQQIIGGFMSVGLLVAVVAQIHNWRDRSREGRKSALFLIVLSIIPLLIIVNPLGSPRYVFGVIALGLLAAFGAYATLPRYRLTSLLALVGMVILFPIFDSFRYSTTQGLEDVNPIQAFQGGDFDAFAQIINTVEFVQTTGSTAGWQLLGVALFWVPRSVWPAKPMDTGTLLAESKGYGFANISAPLPAELYINGGWGFVIVATIGLGWLMRGWDARSNAEADNTGAPTVLGCVLPFYIILLLRGSLLQAMANLAVILLVWLLISKPQANDAPSTANAM